jgi:hypothetical protein
MIHQLVRAGRECEGPLLAQHPDLAAVTVPEFDHSSQESDARAWLADLIAVYGETREVGPLAPGQYTRVDPVDELVQAIGPDRVITAVADRVIAGRRGTGKPGPS